MLENVTNILFANSDVYTCGSGRFEFEGIFPTVVSTIVTIIKIGVPILLIVLGMIDLGKAIMAQKEDEIKKGQALFVKRLIGAILVFLVVFIVQIVVRFIAKSDNANISSCINCFISGAEATGGDKTTGCYLAKDKTDFN